MTLRTFAMCLALAASLAGCDDGDTDDGGLASGEQLFTTRCLSCHGADGTGTDLGPDMTKFLNEHEPTEFKTLVKEGREAMPPFDSLTDGDLDDLITFVNTLSVQR
ncbi:MAG: mono/diheme cytochrome c family protein [Kiritimatiellia bacterium]|jgi:mono/diheme cytochrome c family protein